MTNVEKEICASISYHIRENNYSFPIWMLARFETIINYDTDHIPENELRYDLRMGGPHPMDWYDNE